jgi:hypothetical protein
MGNYVIGVGNYVIVSPSKLRNYKIADNRHDRLGFSVLSMANCLWMARRASVIEEVRESAPSRRSAWICESRRP